MDKPALIGKAFSAYLHGRIDYNQFVQMAAGINRALMQDLLRMAEMEYGRTEDNWGANLMSSGLANISVLGLYGGDQIYYLLNETGKLVLEICFDHP